MKKIEECRVAALSNNTPCGLVKWSLLAILVVLLLAPKEAASLDCDFSVELFEDAAKECEAGVRHEGVKYQPCDLVKLYEPNYRTCSGAPPVEEPQNEFGVVMVVNHMLRDNQLVAAASQEGFKQAKLTALKGCMQLTGKAKQCKELDRFGDDTCFAVAEARYGTKIEFVTAIGDSRGDAEIEAISWCKDYVPKSALWARHCNVQPSKCSSDEIQCSIELSGCSPYEVVDSMKEFEFRRPQTLKEVSKMHKKHKEPAGKSDKPKTEDPSPPKKPKFQELVGEFEKVIRHREFMERFGSKILDALKKAEDRRAMRWDSRGRKYDIRERRP